MFINRLIVSKTPVWLDVEGGILEKFEIKAKIKNWPVEKRGVALFIFDFSSPVTDAELAENKLARSTSIGPYVYFQPNASRDFVFQKISLPNGVIKRIGIQLWNSEHDILLEDVYIEASGGSLRYAHAREDISFDSASLEKVFKEVPSYDNILSLGLLADHSGCDAACVAKCGNWFASLDRYAINRPSLDFRRTNCIFVNSESEKVPVAVYHAKPAMLRIPGDAASYLKNIGDKSRNMIRKAERLGYFFKKVNPNDYLDDVLAIRISDPMRQGQPIPQYYSERPGNIIREQRCPYHGEDFYGVFLGENLIAYVTLFLYGELAQINHILGHKDHMRNGVMNLLMYEAVCQIIQLKPWIKAINYLYGAGTSGTALFKAGIGFKEEALIVTEGCKDANIIVPERDTGDGDETAWRSAADRSKDDCVIKLRRISAEIDNVIEVERVSSRHSAVASAIDILREPGSAERKIIVCNFSSADFDETISAAVAGDILLINGMSLDNCMGFLTTQLKKFRKNLPEGVFVLFDFVRTLGIPVGDGAILHDYIRKRFKSEDLSIEDIRTGFKGSDYVVKGAVDYDPDGIFPGFDCIVMLKKIR